MSYRPRILERDRYCRGCGGSIPSQQLHVHHILFRSQGGPDEDWNLISLCPGCHDKAHGIGGRRFPRWLLHLTVMWDVRMPVEWMMRRKQEVPACCLSCNKYGDAGYCVLWEEEYQPDYLCNAWRLRELR